METKGNVYKVLTFCSSISEKSDNVPKHGNRNKVKEQQYTEANITEEKVKISGCKDRKNNLNAYSFQTRFNNNNKLGNKNVCKAKEQISPTIQVKDYINNRVITIQPKNATPDKVPETMIQTTDTRISEQAQEPNAVNDNYNSRRKLLRKGIQLGLSNKKVIRETNREPPMQKDIIKDTIVSNEDTRRNEYLENQRFSIDQKNKQDGGDDKIVSVKTKPCEGEKDNVTQKNFKPVASFYFNRNDEKEQNLQRKHTNKKFRKKRKITHMKSRSIHMFRVPSKLPVRRKKIRAKLIDLDYFRKKLSIHINSSSSHTKQSLKKDDVKAKQQIQNDQKTDEAVIMFNRRISNLPTSSTRSNTNLRRSRSNDIFGFRKSNWPVHPWVCWKMNKRHSCPNTTASNCCRSKGWLNNLTICNSDRDVPKKGNCDFYIARDKSETKLKKSEKIKLCETLMDAYGDVPCETSIDVKQKISCNSLRNKAPTISRPCLMKFKTVEFPSRDDTRIKVYNLANKHCVKAKGDKNRRNVCCGKSCEDFFADEEDFNGGGGDNAIQQCTRCEGKSESPLFVVVKSCLICSVMICWLPCIILVFLCWLISYPMRPHARVNAYKEPFWDSFVNWVQSAKWFNLSFLDVFWSLSRGSSCKTKIQPKNVISKHEIKQNKLSLSKRSNSDFPCGFPNKNRLYTLAHSTGRGWVVRPVKEEKMPPSILKKPGQSCNGRSCNSARIINFKDTPCPSCLEQDSQPRRSSYPKVSQRCQTGLQGICIQQPKGHCGAPIIVQQSAAPLVVGNSSSATCRCSQINRISVAQKNKCNVCRETKKSCKCKIGPWKKFARNCKNNMREYKEFQKNSYDPNASCGEMFNSRNKTCCKVRECCPEMYPLAVQLHSMCKNCCQGLLLVISACIWIPWMLCCYLCAKCLCACFN